MAAIKILSVDDEAPLELLMKQYFRRKIRNGEYEFFFAHNGLEALSILYNNPDIEIVLSDINMPEMDGLTLLAKVNEMRNPALRVIMVSAYGDMKNIREAMNNGAFDFATKPIDMDDLSLTIEKAIAQINYVHESMKEHAQLESLKNDLTTARDIQQYILPRVFPPFPEYTDKVDIYASMEAAKDIGGDFYDFFRIDVCGKGIPAALFMAVSRTIIRSKGMQGCSAETCMTESNHLLAAYSIDNMFVTVFYAIYNVKTGFISYSNAGHNPPLLLRQDGSFSELPVMENTIVGVIDNIEYQKDTLQLEQGDTLFMFTDGVTEATDAAYNEFGVERLGDILSQHSHSNCQQIVEAVKKGVKDFVGETEQSDDITMLVVKRL